MRLKTPEFGRHDVGRYARNGLFALFYLAILFCLADGIFDIVLSQKDRINDRAHKVAADMKDPAALIAGVVPARTYYMFTDLKVAEENVAIGAIPLPLSRPGLHIGNNGERATAPVTAPGATGIVLGASQAFGLYNRDDETLAAGLQRALPGVAMRTFAVPGQEVRQSIVWWRTLRNRGVDMDFAVLESGPTDLVQCRSVLKARPVPARSIALSRLFRGEPGERSGHGAPRCRTPEEIALQVDRLIYDYESALTYARSIDVPLAIILPPIPYGNHADRSNLPSGEGFLNPLTVALRRRLKDHPIPGVYDLSDAFDGGPRYFIDLNGHTSAQGQNVLARAIVARVGAAFFAPHGQKSK